MLFCNNRHVKLFCIFLAQSEKLILQIRPEFFYFLVLGKFLGKPSVGGGNKNKNKIQKFPESE